VFENNAPRKIFGNAANMVGTKYEYNKRLPTPKKVTARDF